MDPLPPTSSSSSLVPITSHLPDSSSPQHLQRGSSASIKPLSSLPIELHHHIHQFCDTPTLAKTSLVSLAILELTHSSSPLQESRHQPIRADEETLFFFWLSTVVPLPTSTRAPSLSLYYVRSFTFTIVEQDYRVYHFSMDRLTGGSRPLAVEELYIRTSTRLAFPLHLFDPSSATFEAPLQPSSLFNST
ncbi:hypothetical protein BDY24DRAFT_412347 [Mrakia frigida]|uniref:uncharacterized protein n=1 Tax=Mrakia frigida TaxID=29902 RepID=UPI003FCC26C4